MLRSRHFAIIGYTAIVIAAMLQGLITTNIELAASIAPYIGAFAWDKYAARKDILPAAP